MTHNCLSLSYILLSLYHIYSSVFIIYSPQTLPYILLSIYHIPGESERHTPFDKPCQGEDKVRLGFLYIL